MNQSPYEAAERLRRLLAQPARPLSQNQKEFYSNRLAELEYEGRLAA